MLDKGAQAGIHSYEARGDDTYFTPPEAVRALLRCERLPTVIWEPACGSGNIVKVLRTVGHKVYATDLHPYGGMNGGVDFLTTEVWKSFKLPVGAIVTNPPFKLAARFIFRALEITPFVAVLVRLGFYESERRTKLLEESGLARIHVFRNRLPMMHREGWTGPKASSAIAFAWFTFIRGYDKPTIIDRISWVAANEAGRSDGEAV